MDALYRSTHLSKDDYPEEKSGCGCCDAITKLFKKKKIAESPPPPPPTLQKKKYVFTKVVPEHIVTPEQERALAQSHILLEALEVEQELTFALVKESHRFESIDSFTAFLYRYPISPQSLELNASYLSSEDKKGRTPLFAAVSGHNTNAVRYIVTNQARFLNIFNEQSVQKVLHKAIEIGDPSLVAALFEPGFLVYGSQIAEEGAAYAKQLLSTARPEDRGARWKIYYHVESNMPVSI
jgi:hypothetical protein